jgi:hypothetical protein
VDTQESGKRELFSSYFQPEKPQNLRYIAIAMKSEALNIERSHDYVSRREKSIALQTLHDSTAMAPR